MTRPFLSIALRAVGIAAVAMGVRACGPARPPSPGLAPVAPATLAETGLYADWASKRVAADVVAYAPQYPLWTDGAAKRRWLRLPPGTAIDGRDPDNWQFPVGTRLWKEFGYDRRVETRYMERVADGWLMATYVFGADEATAVLGPAREIVVTVEGGPESGYAIPGAGDCTTCHDPSRPVLGLGALQLSDDRDPLAPHAESRAPVTNTTLIERGLLVGVPDASRAPRVAGRTPVERAALGYLYGNCAPCHRSDGPLASLAMSFDDAGEALDTTIGRPSRWRPPGVTAALRVRAGEPEHSALLLRLRTDDVAARMPPLGRRAVDADAVALIERWIDEVGHRASSR